MTSENWLRDQIQAARDRGNRNLIIVAPALLSLQITREALVLPPGLDDGRLHSLGAQATAMKLPLLCIRVEAWTVEALFFLTTLNELPIIGFSEEKDFQLQAESQSEQSAMDMLKRWSQVKIASKLLRAPIISTAHDLVFDFDEGGNETHAASLM